MRRKSSARARSESQHFTNCHRPEKRTASQKPADWTRLTVRKNREKTSAETLTDRERDCLANRSPQAVISRMQSRRGREPGRDRFSPRREMPQYPAVQTSAKRGENFTAQHRQK